VLTDMAAIESAAVELAARRARLSR
jgi:hypothetical protein